MSSSASDIESLVGGRVLNSVVTTMIPAPSASDPEPFSAQTLSVVSGSAASMFLAALREGGVPVDALGDVVRKRISTALHRRLIVEPAERAAMWAADHAEVNRSSLLLRLPKELRDEVYRCVLEKKPRNVAALLRVNHQVNAEVYDLMKKTYMFVGAAIEVSKVQHQEHLTTVCPKQLQKHNSEATLASRRKLYGTTIMVHTHPLEDGEPPEFLWYTLTSMKQLKAFFRDVALIPALPPCLLSIFMTFGHHTAHHSRNKDMESLILREMSMWLAEVKDFSVFGSEGLDEDITRITNDRFESEEDMFDVLEYLTRKDKTQSRERREERYEYADFAILDILRSSQLQRFFETTPKDLILARLRSMYANNNERLGRYSLRKAEAKPSDSAERIAAATQARRYFTTALLGHRVRPLFKARVLGSRARAYEYLGAYGRCQADLEECLRQNPGHRQAKADLKWLIEEKMPWVRKQRDLIEAMSKLTLEEPHSGSLKRKMGVIVVLRCPRHLLEQLEQI